MSLENILDQLDQEMQEEEGRSLSAVIRLLLERWLNGKLSI